MNVPSTSKQVRVNNIRVLLKAVCNNSPISKRALQQLTGFSWGTVSYLTATLQHCGFVIPVGKQHSVTGRKADELDINPNDNYVIGVDLSVVGLCAVVTDLKGRIVQECSAVFSQLQRTVVLQTLFSLLDGLFEQFRDKTVWGIGLAAQGLVNTEKGLSVLIESIDDWRDVPLRDELMARYACPAVIWHDPDCIMMAECVFGALTTNTQNALLVHLDQGIGLSILNNGKLFTGASNRVGELGGMMVDRDHSLDFFSSGTNLAKRAASLIRQKRLTLLSNKSPDSLTYHDVAVAARNGDPLCRELFREAGEKLGLAFCSLYSLMDPEQIVLHGALCQYRDLFYDALEEQLQKNAYLRSDTPLAFSTLGSNATAHGAAYMMADETIQTIQFEVPDTPDVSDVADGVPSVS